MVKLQREGRGRGDAIVTLVEVPLHLIELKVSSRFVNFQDYCQASKDNVTHVTLEMSL